jgi:4'-phosphopantetheinyl transferase EntD
MAALASKNAQSAAWASARPSERCMMSHTDPTLVTALLRLVEPDIRIGHRIIAPGDENALLDAELPGFVMAATKVRRQSGAARMVARELMEGLGFRDIALPRSASGAPVWPPGIVGSLAHDDSVAVAAVASAGRFRGVGIDVEPAFALPPELAARVATAAERRRYPTAVIESRLLFTVKEAIFKALNPIDGVFLDFRDVDVDLDDNRGRTKSGHCIQVAFTTAPRIVAVAFVQQPDRRSR